MRLSAVMLVSAAFMLGGSLTVQAQTVGFADAIKILSASCGKDIDTYCKSANLGNNEIGACLDKNQSKISAQCQTDRVRVSALLEARMAAQAAAPKICDADIRQLCKLVKKGSGHVLRCLLKAERAVSKKCNQAIDFAGYR
ncbi:hypothetical protein [Roseibium sp.]|uniref:hypothetical protein n=1 Tax=Roseibium sp. TaxID=1936156 RepID=UPI003A978231